MEIMTETFAWAVGAVLAMMAIDIVTGFVQAVVNHCVSSTKIREGLLHKVSILLVIAAVTALEVAGEHVAGIGIDGMGTVAVCAVVILMEFVSVWENACKANPTLKDSPLGMLLEDKTGGDAK